MSAQGSASGIDGEYFPIWHLSFYEEVYDEKTVPVFCSYNDCRQLDGAYLHEASQWDGTFDSVAENGTAVYIFIAENDEYYGSQKAREAYQGLYNAYHKAGVSENRMDEVIHLQIPDNE